MSETILAKPDLDPRVLDLATDIRTAQEPEIDQLQRWLPAWGAEDIGSMDHGAHAMEGLMTKEDMAALEATTGADAERMFLEQMIQHHTGAIEMPGPRLRTGRTRTRSPWRRKS